MGQLHWHPQCQFPDENFAFSVKLLTMTVAVCVRDDCRRTVQYQRVACRRRLQAMKPVVASVLHVGYARLPHVAARASGHPFTGCSPSLTSPWTHDQAISALCHIKQCRIPRLSYFSATASEAPPPRKLARSCQEVHMVSFLNCITKLHLYLSRTSKSHF